MMNTPDSSRVTLRKRTTQHPGTPETTCSSEQGCEVCLGADFGPKADLIESLPIMESKTKNSRPSEVNRTSKGERHDRQAGRLSSNESVVAKAEKHLIEDDNSILASQQDESSYLSNLEFLNFILDPEEDSACVGSDDSEIQAAIEVIRKEASQIDQLILYDQLKTLECELEAINKQYSARSMEIEDLKAQLEEKEDRCANLELERSLYQADATKLREDLRTCVEKMFDISMYQSALDCETSSQKVGEMKRRLLRPPSGDESISENHLGDFSGPQQLRILGLTSHPRKVLRARPPILSDPDLLTLYSKQKWSEDSDSAHLLPSKKDSEKSRNQDVFRRRGRQSFRVQTKGATQKSSLLDDRDQWRTHRPLKARAFSLETKTYHQPDEYNAEEKGTATMCGIFRRRSKQAQQEKDSQILMMKNQINQLQELMKTSLSASEKLRKRIATISRYYEGVIGQLQAQVTELKAEKCRNEIQLKNELSEAEQKLKAKDREIAQLKATLSGVDQGEV
ncbi:hypothetical protein IV203_006070 [Nitzschia inconspicua]|uniref:Uncharacterized protein n=1 Tax=Nitzschia inconspicua TaxID=303405 RepID=A0A9K3KP83_9STRA|nr:hypothetical protein IV203_006070 [Nitzschia inconspicua]